MICNKVIRYGYENKLYRVLTVEMNENIACSGGSLHLVRAVSIADGIPSQWWIRNLDLSRYGYST